MEQLEPEQLFASANDDTNSIAVIVKHLSGNILSRWTDFLTTDGEKETLICLDVSIAPETVSHFKAHTDTKFICLERALDTTTKYNLKHYLGDKFNAF